MNQNAGHTDLSPNVTEDMHFLWTSISAWCEGQSMLVHHELDTVNFEGTIL